MSADVRIEKSSDFFGKLSAMPDPAADARVSALARQRIQIVEGHIFTLVRKEHGTHGVLKTLKFAYESERKVARLVFSVEMLPKKERAVRINRCLHGLSVVNYLKSRAVSGIYEHIAAGKVVRADGTIREDKYESFDRYYSEGDLLSFVNDGMLSDSQCDEFGVKLLNTLSAMHELDVCHCDIKPDNVLLGCDPAGNYELALCDFDESVLPGDVIEDTYHGTPLYTSPETAGLFVLEGGRPMTVKEMKANDVWSMGILLYITYMKKVPPGLENLVPMNGNDILSSLAFMTEDLFDEPSEKKSVLHLIWKMLRVDPELRINAGAAFEEMQNLLAPAASSC